MSKLRKKLLDKKGETLAEVLVAVLVSAAGMLLLSSIIMSSVRIVDKSNASMAVMYDGATAMELKDADQLISAQISVTFDREIPKVLSIPICIYKDDASNLVSYTAEGTTP
ncbi:Tfp pilus assembly protein PilV [Clostridiales Family XIII bacterium PM5-7]